MEYVILWAVWLAGALVARRWWVRKQAWRAESDAWARETSRWLAEVRALPPMSRALWDLNRARRMLTAVQVERETFPMRVFDGIDIMVDRDVPDGKAFVMNYAATTHLVMNPKAAAMITGVTS